MKDKFDVALSFSADDLEQEVKKVKVFLEAAGLKVFYFKDRQDELMSYDLDEKTYQIYHEQSLVKVLFISKLYGQHKYTQLEKRLSVDSTKLQPECLIIVNYLGEEIEPEFGTLVYIDGNKKEPDEIAMMIQQRVLHLKEAKGKQKKKSENKKSDCRNRTIILSNNHGIVTGDNATFDNITFN